MLWPILPLMLIVCVYLTGLSGVLIPGKELFLCVCVCVCVRVFLEEISVWIGKLNTGDHPSQCSWASSNLLRAWIERKGGSFRLRLNYTTDFLVLQLSHCWLCDFSVSIICESIPIIMDVMYISYWFCFSGEHWLICYFTFFNYYNL